MKTAMLKTLNEIIVIPPLILGGGDFVPKRKTDIQVREDLRTEAIRKVKAIDGCAAGIQIMGGFVLRGPRLHTIRGYIMWQNNLTEADLE